MITRSQSLLMGIFCIALMVTGCRKEDEDNTPDSPACTETSIWSVAYQTSRGTLYPPDSIVINNGIAKLQAGPYDLQPQAFMTLSIPDCRVFSADSIKMDVFLKPGITGIGSPMVFLQIIGDKDSAWAYFISSTGLWLDPHNYFGLTKGSPELVDIPEMYQGFSDWTIVSLKTTANMLSVSRNDTLIKSIDYSPKQLGKLKGIRFGFRWVGSVDWVKVYDHADKLLFKEEFNNGKHSNVEWY